MEGFLAIIFVVISIICASIQTAKKQQLSKTKAAANLHDMPNAPEDRLKAGPAHITPKVMRPVKVDVDLSAYEEGMSRTDADGCIGGSIESHEEEGESLAEHTAHLPAIPAAPQPRSRRVGASDLRRAVVMSEILNRPVSLRR